MAEEDDSQKTEDASDKKLAEGKKKGNVAQSQEVKSWLILMAGLAGLALLGPYMANNIRMTIFPFIYNGYAIPTNFDNMTNLLIDMSGRIGLIVAPLLGLLVVVAIFANIVQIGFVYSPEKIQPDINKLSLKKGFKKMFSSKAFVEFLKGILKLIAVGIISFMMAMPMLKDLTLIPFMEIDQSLDRIYIIAILLMVGTVIMMTLISAMDFAFQKFSFLKEMKMSKQEVKDEHKQSEGDPHVKARIRRVRTERAQQRMMAAVPDADVVITNPTHYSIALEYKMDDMRAPKLVAKGVDHLAFRIREVAKAHDVPLVENAPLARALYAGVELNEEIPPEHFKAVAEIIGFVMRQRGDLPPAGDPQIQ
ncbi:MAG: flagellar biosynthesis protein FlhB [Rhodospirillales bacterium]|nr:flagellar biosynthesis protein FlhB [Rhodospirillales bacterium]